MAYSIFAHHAHVFPKEVRADGTVDELLRVMERCGIDAAVCFATFHSQLGPGGPEPNRWLADQLKAHPQLYGFGVIDFTAEDLEDQVERIAALGFRGIKIHPAFQKIRIDGEKACRVYAKAQELGLFLSFHSGIHWHRIADYNMLLFDEVAFRFPRLRFSMEHLGGYCFFQEGLAVLQNNRSDPRRLYAGLTSVFDRGDNRAWYLSDDRIKDLLWQDGEDGSFFGLDFPYNGAEKIAYAIQHVKALDIPESAKEKILGGNLRRALQLP